MAVTAISIAIAGFAVLAVAGCTKQAPVYGPNSTPATQSSLIGLDFRVGETAVTRAGYRITVYSLRSIEPVTYPHLTPNAGYWGADVEVCADALVQFHAWTFSLAMTDNTRVESMYISPPLGPISAFPTSTVLQAGDCVRGVLLFEVPNGKQPSSINYFNYVNLGSGIAPIAVRWVLR